MSNVSHTRSPQESNNLWILRARVLLQRSVDDLDAATRSRLNRARQAALESMDRPPPIGAVWRWAGVAAMVAGLAVMVAPRVFEQLDAPGVRGVDGSHSGLDAMTTHSPLTAPDFELLAEDEQFEILQDLEFYAWLESSEVGDG